MRAALAELVERSFSSLSLHRTVHDTCRNSERIQRMRQVLGVFDVHAKGNRPSIARELLDGACDQRVTFFDIDGLCELRFVEVETASGQ